MQRYYLGSGPRHVRRATRVAPARTRGIRMSLEDRIATPEGKRRYVRVLFATIADRYDFITVALSYGQDRRWKRRVIEMAAPRAGALALDLATGTGDIAFGLAARGARVVGLDITARMLTLAQAKNRDGRVVKFMVG